MSFRVLSSTPRRRHQMTSNVSPTRMPQPSQISEFLAKYTPEVAAQLLSARQQLAAHFPRGFELVYDNYNALLFGFASSERASDVVVSVAGYPKWVTLFFLHGAKLNDPMQVLEGRGTQVRSVRLQPFAKLQEPAVQALIMAAKLAASSALDAAPPFSTVIKSVSPRQRERRPPDAKKFAASKATTRGGAV